MAKNLKDIISKRSGRKVSKDEDEFLATHTVDTTDYPSDKKKKIDEDDNVKKMFCFNEYANLKDVISKNAGRNVPKGEEDFLAIHTINDQGDVNNNKNVFKADNVKKIELEKKHGYSNIKAAEKAYEEIVTEASCNMTEAGKMCPAHGLKECMSEKTNIIKEKSVKEKAEEIDEVSSKLLNRAMHAAVKKAGWLMPGDKGKGDKVWNRAKKFQKAGLAKQDKEKSERLRSSQKNEDVEQIDEIGDTDKGKKVLGNYIKKAAQSATSAAYNAGTTKSVGLDAKAQLDQERKRKAGIGQAVTRLTKEEADTAMQFSHVKVDNAGFNI
jgi:hypothetical protein